MRIAFFSESYKPYTSGVTNSIEILKTRLESLGHKTLIFAPDYPNVLSEQNVYRYPAIPSPYPGYRLAIPFSKKNYEVLKEAEINIIHSHSPVQLGLLSMWYAKKLKVPFVFTMHTMLNMYTHYIPLLPYIISSRLIDKYVRWFCNKCSCVIAPTNNVKKGLIEIGVKTRIEVVPTGIDLSNAAKADGSYVRTKHGIPSNAKILLFAGRLAKEKNIPFLFRAFEVVAMKVPNVVLLIAAGGPMEKELKKIAPPNAIFAGNIPYSRIFDYYKASDLFVFSSLTETQGLVIAEAMACGLPQVVVDAEGVSDVVINGQTGYLTKENEEDFCNKVIELLTNNVLREEMSEESVEQAKIRYSSEAFAKKIELVYRSVL
jgi:1,2-diacylglycerol 3-alpha-glucosyltransferase